MDIPRGVIVLIGLLVLSVSLIVTVYGIEADFIEACTKTNRILINGRAFECKPLVSGQE